MNKIRPPENDFTRYLKLLGLTKKQPSLLYLKELTFAHLTKIPFENISKIYYKINTGLHHLPDLNLFLTGIEKYNFGGTCYANNYYFNLLLNYLGFKVKLCGADMSNPDVHIVNIVIIRGREYIVDGGYGAPFLFPMLRETHKSIVINRGHEKFILKPKDRKNRSELEYYRNGKLTHGYIVKPQPRQIEYFDKIIKKSYRKDAAFLNALSLARFKGKKSYIVHNMTFIEYDGEKTKIKKFTDRNKLAELIFNKFKIPDKITVNALDGLKLRYNNWN